MSTIKSSDEHLTLNADGTSKDIKLQSNASEKVIIKSDGKVGIGTSSPSYGLHVETSVDGDFASLIHNTDADNGQGLMIRAGADSGEAILSLRNQASSEKFKVLADGNVLVNETVSGHADAGTTVITNKALGKAALTLKSLQTHAAGVGTEIVALNFAAHNYYSASNPGIYGQISCENGNGSYSDRGQLVLSTGYGGNQITERLVLTSDGRGLSEFTAKAWVNFNGTSTVAIRDSHNVSSITDNGTGDYTVNFSNNMANANYSLSGLGNQNTTASSSASKTITPYNFATGSFKIRTGFFATNEQFRDFEYVTTLVFGD